MKVCILGDGLTGLTLAKALVNQKIYVDLVSQRKKSPLNNNRTIGMSKSNIEYFNTNIINIKKISWNLKKIEIFSDKLKKERLLNFENKNEFLFSIIKNNKLYEILNTSLKKNKFYKKIPPKENLNLLENYNLIFNTDYENFITKKYFSKKISKIYNNLAYTTIIKHNKIENNIATQIFTKRGPLAFLPISNFETSIVYSINYSDGIKDINISELINLYNLKYKIQKIEKVNFFELKSFNLRSYYHKNILAFGDLLHKIHPLAGQGFNMTIRDIIILTNIIKEKTSLGLNLDKSVNIEFEKKLRHKNYIFTNGIDFIYEFFNIERKIKSNILSKSVQKLGSYPSFSKIFTSIADRGF